MLRAFTVLSTLAALSVAGCGDDAATTTDAPGPGADAPTADASPDGPARAFGEIQIQQTFLGLTDVMSHVARFLAEAPPKRTEGACTIYSSDAMPPRLDAGTLAFSTSGGAITLMPDPDFDYGEGATMHVYAPGFVIDILGTGATVPAFTQSIEFPADITAQTPVFSRAGFPVGWTGAGAVRVIIAKSSSNVAILCDYDGVTSATIPAAALTDIASGDQLVIQIGSLAKKAFSAGTFDIAITAFSASYSGGQSAME